MKKIYLDLLDKYFETNKIAMCIAQAQAGIVSSIPEQKTALLPGTFVDLCIQDFLLQGRDKQHPLIMMMDPTYFIGIAQLDAENFLIFGPVSPLKQTPEEIRKISLDFMSVEQLSAFSNVIMRTPLMGYRSFVSAFCLAIFLACGENVDSEAVFLCNNAFDHKLPESVVQEGLFVTREDQLAHASRSFEASLMEAVRLGDSELLTKRALRPLAGRAGKMSNDAVRQERYVFITVITQATRAAIDAGVPEEEAYTLSDTYSLKMDSLTAIRDISLLTFTMLLAFCKLVAKHLNTVRYSRTIRDCLDYISIHLHENISLEDLSDLTGLCTRTISKKFRQETSQTLAIYIQQQKIEEAKHLLCHTNYTFSEISDYLNFCSQSYFTKVFKEAVGTTPQQYRNQQ